MFLKSWLYEQINKNRATHFDQYIFKWRPPCLSDLNQIKSIIEEDTSLSVLTTSQLLLKLMVSYILSEILKW